MKKTAIFVIVMLVLSFVIVSVAGCTVNQKIVASMSYNEESGMCTLVNKTNSNYKKFTVYFDIFDEAGNRKEVQQNIGEFNKGSIVHFNIEKLIGNNKIERVELNRFSYEPTALIILIRVLIIVFFITCVLIATIALCKINKIE